MPPGLRRFHPAPAVDDLFLFHLRIVNAGKGADVGAQYLGQLPRTRLALGTVGVGQQVQRALNGQCLAIDLELQAGDGLIEHPFPSIADDAEIMEEFLHFVGQLIRLHGADAVKHRLVTCKIGVLVEQVGQMIVGQFVQLQCKEHQRRGIIGDLFLHVGHELGAARVRGQLVIAQARVGHDAPGDLIDLFVTQHAVEQPLGVQLGQFAFVVRCKARAGFFQPVQIALEFRCIFARVKIAQVPFRQIAKVLAPGSGIGVAKREGKLKHRCTSFAFRHIYAPLGAGTTYP